MLTNDGCLVVFCLHCTATKKAPGKHGTGSREDQAKQVQSISIVKGKLSDHRFHIGEEPTTVSEKPVESLGRWYDASLRDKEQVDQLRKEVASGLENIEGTLLPGKLKLWCMQYGLLPRLMWPLTLYVSHSQRWKNCWDWSAHMQGSGLAFPGASAVFGSMAKGYYICSFPVSQRSTSAPESDCRWCYWIQVIHL